SLLSFPTRALPIFLPRSPCTGRDDGSAVPDDEFDTTGTRCRFVQYGPTRFGNIQDPWLRTVEQGAQPAVRTQLLQRLPIAAEHDPVQFVRPLSQHLRGIVRCGPQRMSDLAR